MPRAALLRDAVGLTVAALAALSLLAADHPYPAPPFVVLVAVALIAVWIAWQDLTDFTIPDGAVAGLALVGITHRVIEGATLGAPLVETGGLIGFDAALAGGGFWALREVYFRRRGFDGLGMGDVKLAAAAAVLTGATGFALALGAASVLGIGWALATRPADTPLGSTRIAFGAVLAPMVALVFVAGAVGLAPTALG
jgi:leader peptidase (prepilin peptidase) / N-methyltransferase